MPWAVKWDGLASQTRGMPNPRPFNTRDLEAGTCAGWSSARKPEVDGVTASSVSSVSV